jgi:hypothetical protein
MARIIAIACVACAIACSGKRGRGDADDDVAPDTALDADGGTDASDAGDPEGDLPGDAVDEPVEGECAPGEMLCLDHATRRVCLDDPGGARWHDEVCPDGEGCVSGLCVAGECSDECDLGGTDGSRTCGLLDIATGGWIAVDPAGSMHDRARAYEMWLRRDSLYHGGVGNALYSDPPACTDVVSLGGTGDSAIWTGTYLAAEALRLMATGSADARDRVIDLVETLHLWFNVAGEPGLLARYAAPSGDHPLVDMDCSTRRIHCDVEFEGETYDYSGHISRDQYQGVMLGYALAYEALGEHDEPTRALIREDVVELVEELMRLRSVSVRLTWDGTELPVFDVDMRFAVLAPAEMTGGAVDLIIDSSNYDDSEMYGFQEFIPDWGLVIRQFPGLGWVPDIPRTGSAIMLSSFFRVGLLVTEGVEGYEDEHAGILGFYLGNSDWGGNVDDWLDRAGQWSYSGTCGSAYYANNIAMEPMYNLARLEDDPVLGARIVDGVLHGRMWPEFVATKNPWFSFIYAASVPYADPSVAPAAASQLSQFPPPPRVRVAVDLRSDARYMPHESGCTDQVDHGMAVDVGDRVVSDFIWQRHPWGLYDDGLESLTYPGVDYLAAYWLGRRHGFLADDRPGTCLAWRD